MSYEADRSVQEKKLIDRKLNSIQLKKYLLNLKAKEDKGAPVHSIAGENETDWMNVAALATMMTDRMFDCGIINRCDSSIFPHFEL